jgi:hypothetical protein
MTELPKAVLAARRSKRDIPKLPGTAGIACSRNTGPASCFAEPSANCIAGSARTKFRGKSGSPLLSEEASECRKHPDEKANHGNNRENDQVVRLNRRSIVDSVVRDTPWVREPAKASRSFRA